MPKGILTVEDYQGSDGKKLRMGLITAGEDKKENTQPLLFIAGLGGSVKGALDFLDDLLPVYDPIYGADLRGFGLNYDDQANDSMETIYNDLLELIHLIQERHSNGPIALCGISLGGALATKLCAEFPEKFQSVLIIAPAYKADSRTFTLAYTLKNVAALIHKGPNYRAALPYDINLITRNPSFREDPQYKDAQFTYPVKFLLDAKNFNQEAFNLTRQIKIPTMFVIPGSDMICDVSAMRKGYERVSIHYSQKACKEYPNAYHDILMEEEATQVARDIIDWQKSTFP